MNEVPAMMRRRFIESDMGSTPQQRRRSLANKEPRHAAGMPNRLRIIGGLWRGTRLQFPAVESIRPTPDRVRETLFNWLQHATPGARCLDLYAGSGALGLEALSRGARAAVFVDKEPEIGRYLRDTLARLKSAAGEVHSTDAETFLQGSGEPFDIVFLDPPFATGALTRICDLLERRRWLAPTAYIYLECPAASGTPAVPANWQLVRSKQAGQVGYHLARRVAAASAQDRFA